MLTKSDLSDIRKVVREEIKVDVKGLNVRLDNTDSGLKSLEIQVNSLEKNTQNGFNKLGKKLDKFFNFLDKEDMQTKKRIIRIEEHLKLPPLT